MAAVKVGELTVVAAPVEVPFLPVVWADTVEVVPLSHVRVLVMVKVVE